MTQLRRHARYSVTFPVALDSPAKSGRVGVVKNVSATGILLGTPSRFEAGQRVRVRFKSKLDGPSIDLPGTIVRTGLDSDGDWLRRTVAIEFDRAVSAKRLGELAHSYAPR